jgi:hypothetical protein
MRQAVSEVEAGTRAARRRMPQVVAGIALLVVVTASPTLSVGIALASGRSGSPLTFC